MMWLHQHHSFSCLCSQKSTSYASINTDQNVITSELDVDESLEVDDEH